MLRASLLTLVLAVALTGCGGSGGPSPTAEPGELVELATAEPLRRAFAESEGEPRLLLLLSPT